MKLSEIKSLNEKESLEKVKELRTELAKEKALLASGTKSEKPGRIRNIKRTIARILTTVNENKTNEGKK